MMGSSTWRRSALAAMLLGALVAGCERAGPPRIETSDDLTEAVQDRIIVAVKKAITTSQNNRRNRRSKA